MSLSGAINWSDLRNTVGNGCGLYNNTISYVDSGWKVKTRDFPSYECDIRPEGGHSNMDSLMSVLVRLNSMHPDIQKAYIHVREGENYICTMDDRFQLYASDEVATLAMCIMQSLLKQGIARKNRKARNSKEEG